MSRDLLDAHTGQKFSAAELEVGAAGGTGIFVLGVGVVELNDAQPSVSWPLGPLSIPRSYHASVRVEASADSGESTIPVRWQVSVGAVTDSVDQLVSGVDCLSRTVIVPVQPGEIIVATIAFLGEPPLVGTLELAGTRIWLAFHAPAIVAL